MNDSTSAREDDPLLPPDGGARQRRGEYEPGKERRWYRTITGVAILAAIAVVIIVALLGLLGLQPNMPQVTEPIGKRIDFDELLRDVEPYMELYRLGLGPFRAMKQRARQSHLPLPNLNSTDPDPRAEGRLGNYDIEIYDIEDTYRLGDVYSTVGKLSSTSDQCTGTMIGVNVMLTADHCLPWGKGEAVWQSIRFTAALDGLNPILPRPWRPAKVVRCVGINPPVQDGRDMAVCQLDWDLGEDHGAGFTWANWPGDGLPDHEQKLWYISAERYWYSIGYPLDYHDGVKPGMNGPFDIDSVSLDKPHQCSLLEKSFFANNGWSGGPAFFWWSNGTVNVGGVVTACVGPNEGSCEDATITTLSAGRRMGSLVTYGIKNWDSRYGFSRWPMSS